MDEKSDVWVPVYPNVLTEEENIAERLDFYADLTALSTALTPNLNTIFDEIIEDRSLSRYGITQRVMGFSDQVCINITENRLSKPESQAKYSVLIANAAKSLLRISSTVENTLFDDEVRDIYADARQNFLRLGWQLRMEGLSHTDADILMKYLISDFRIGELFEVLSNRGINVNPLNYLKGIYAEFRAMCEMFDVDAKFIPEISTPEEDAQGYDFFVRRLDEPDHRIPVQVKGIKGLRRIEYHDGVFLVHVLRTGSPRYEWMQRDAEKMAGYVRHVILNQSDNYCAERLIEIQGEMYTYGPNTAYWIYAPTDSSF